MHAAHNEEPQHITTEGGDLHAQVPRTLDSAELRKRSARTPYFSSLLVRADRVQGQRWPLTCNARQADCRLNDFLEGHRASLMAALVACEDASEFDDDRMLGVLRTILMAPSPNATGQRRCWPLGDLIIALEALKMGEIITSNVRHYEPLAKAFGLRLATYSPYAVPRHPNGT